MYTPYHWGTGGGGGGLQLLKWGSFSSSTLYVNDQEPWELFMTSPRF